MFKRKSHKLIGENPVTINLIGKKIEQECSIYTLTWSHKLIGEIP